jgi:hypothetical protein
MLKFALVAMPISAVSDVRTFFAIMSRSVRLVEGSRIRSLLNYLSTLKFSSLIFGNMMSKPNTNISKLHGVNASTLVDCSIASFSTKLLTIPRDHINQHI